MPSYSYRPVESPGYRQRSSLYQKPPRRRRSRGPLIAVALILIILVAGGLAVGRTINFLRQSFNLGNPFTAAQQAVDPNAGSIPYKLNHGQQVNVLLMGYGGSENDAPYLTDTIMALSIDPANHRVQEVSIPRDLTVRIDAFQNQQPQVQKINAAYAIGMDDGTYQGKRPEFTKVKDRGGKLAEQTVSSISGLHFDGYVAVDFKAFRDLVDALGGVQVCLDGPLDDNQYPDSHNGYIRGGIHFKAGCQQVNGVQALQLARSRHAVQADQASDFGRARRQQLLLNAIRKKATSVNAITKAPALMDALQNDFSTNLGLADLKAVYDWAGKLPDSAIGRAAITNTNFLDDYYLRQGTCGDFNQYTLCPLDSSYQMLRSYFANLFVDPRVLKEAAPIQIVNSSRSLEDMGDRVSQTLGPLGLKAVQPVRGKTTDTSVIYDYSGDKHPLTAKWLSQYFHANVVEVAAGAAPPTSSPPAGGFAVVLGRDYALRWIGQA
jgi:LCP family protein required for cell wall assembly